MAKKSSQIQRTVFTVSLIVGGIVGGIAMTAVAFNYQGRICFSLGTDGVRLELQGTPSEQDSCNA